MTTTQLHQTALTLIARRALTEQRIVLDIAPRDRDSIRRSLAADPSVTMTWDETGRPYYTTPQRLESLAAVATHRVLSDGSIIFPDHVASVA